MSLKRVHFNPGVQRLAKGELRRNRGRTALIFLLAFLPTLMGAWMFGVSQSNGLGFDNTEPFPENVLWFTSSSDEFAAQLAEEPGVVEASFWTEIWGPHLTISDRDLVAVDGFNSFGPWGEVVLVEGRQAKGETEVALSEDAARFLDAGIGDSVRFGTHDLEVVGLASENQNSGRAAYRSSGSIDRVPGQTQLYGFVSFATAAAADRAFLRYYAKVTPQGQIFPRDRELVEPSQVLAATSESTFFVATGMMAAGVIAAAAWAVGFERRLRVVSLAQVGGAEVGHIRAAVTLQALWISGTAVVFAWIVAVGLSVMFDRGLGFFLPALAVHAVVVVGLSTFAAWLPLAQLGSGSISPGLSGRVAGDGTPASQFLQGLLCLVVGLVLLRGTVKSDYFFMPLSLAGVGSVIVGSALVMPKVLRVISMALSTRTASGRLAVRSMNAQWRRSVGVVLAVGGIIILMTAGLLDSEGRRHRPYGSYSAAEGQVSVEVGHPDPVRHAELETLLQELGAVASQGRWHLDVEKLSEFQVLGPSGVEVVRHSGSSGDDQSRILRIGLGCIVVVLLLLGFLMRKEDSERRSALHNLGAPSWLYRRVAAWQGLIMGGIASVCGVSLGVAIHLAVENERPRIVVPYAELALVLVAVPLLATVLFMVTSPGPRSVRATAADINPALI